MNNKQVPARLFKYLSADRFDVLKKRKIRFTQPAALNDPYDCYPVVSCDRNYLASYYNNQIRAGKTSSKNKEEYIKWGISLETNTQMQKKIYDDLLSQNGVFCLTERDDNILMWAHYADNYKGFVLEFDTELLIPGAKLPIVEEGLQDNVYYPVDYDLEKRPQVILRSPGEDSQSNVEIVTALTAKSKAWEYEKEWRVFKKLSDLGKKDNNSKVHLYSFDIKSIKRIILGCNASRWLQDEVKALKNQKETKHIVVERAKVDPNEFKLNFEELIF